MIDYQSVIIDGLDFGAEGAREIYQNLVMLFTTLAGTVPYDRDFGINIDILDSPLEIAKGRLAVEYVEKVREYEPRVRVEEVQWKTEELEGKLVPRVVINLES